MAIPAPIAELSSELSLLHIELEQARTDWEGAVGSVEPALEKLNAEAQDLQDLVASARQRRVPSVEALCERCS